MAHSLLPVLVAALVGSPLAAAHPAIPGEGSVIAVSESGVMHLDRHGALLAWHPETFQWWQCWHVATNPRNGTVCWAVSPEDQVTPGVMRCARLASLNQTWDLPQPRHFDVAKPDAVAFDWVEENWYLTVGRVNYVCSYLFDHCARTGKSGGNVRYFAAYDIPNRLLFRIATVEAGPYTLEVLNLDGTGLRKLPVNLTYPAGLAVDPIRKQIFIMDKEEGFGFPTGIYKLDYNGEDKNHLTHLDKEGFGVSWRRSLAVIDGVAVAMYNDQKTIGTFSTVDGKKEELVDGAVKDQTIPALAKVEKLLTVKIFSPITQPDVENACPDAGCSPLCIPTLVSGSAEATCLCPKGKTLVDLGCRTEYPLFAVVTGVDQLQAVDLQTEQVTTILSGLTNVSRVDFLWMGDEEFQLFWVDAGSLFSGRWMSGGTVSDVRTLLEGSDKRMVLDVAVDWVHRHLVWMERDTTKSKYSMQISFFLSPLDASYQKNISIYYGNSKQALFIFSNGDDFGYTKDSWGDFEFVTRNMTGSTSYGGIAPYGSKFLSSLPNDIAVDRNLAGTTWQDRYFWISALDEAIDFSKRGNMLGRATRHRLLTHPSLAHAGGLDVLDSRLFWTERSTGLLWTADSETGGGVRALGAATAGGSLRLLHPWRQPPRPAELTPCSVQPDSCSHFCLTGVGWERVAQCECPDGMQLGDDGKTCQTEA